MPFITHRDIDIFKALMPGPATIENIIKQSNFKILPYAGGRKSSGKKTTPPKYTPKSREYFPLVKRLEKLKKDKYLQSQRYINRVGKGSSALYALTHHSIEVLAKNGINTVNTRHTLPNRFTVAHELEVTDAVKTLIQESVVYGYALKIEDENALKSASKGVKEKLLYPDLHVITQYVLRGKKFTLHTAIEIDNNTIPPDQVAEKAKKIYESLKWNVLLLSTTRERIEKLKRAVAVILERDKRLAHNSEKMELMLKTYQAIFFGTQADFSAKGLIGMADVFTKADGRVGSIAPREFVDQVAK